MKIGVFMLNKSGHGGAEKHTAELATRLYRRGHEVSLIASRTVLAAMAGMTTIASPSVPLEEFAPEDLASLPGWRRVLGQASFDTIVLAKGHISQGSIGFHRAAARCGRFITIEHSPAQAPPPTGWRFANGRPHFGFWRYRKILPLWWKARFPESIVFVCHANRSYYRRHFHYPGKRCSTIHNGVDIERFRPDASARSRLFAELELPENVFLFGLVGRLAAQKNQRLALQALADLTQKPDPRTRILELGTPNPESPTNIRLALFGCGEDEDMLRQRVDELGLSENVIFAGNRSDIEKVYPGLDCLLMSSICEGLPLTLLEAFACGCPAVSTAVDGVPEIISQPQFGWLARPGDALDLAAKMALGIATPPEHRQTMGQACRRRVGEQFNATKQFDELINLIVEA